MKLSKKNDKAVLVFDIVGQASRVIRFVIVFGLKKLTLLETGMFQGNGPTPISITHDVTCLVLSPSRVAQLKEPLCPQPDVRVCIGCLRQAAQS